MATTSGQLKEQINAYFSSLTLKQKMMLLGGIASGLAVLIFLLIWTAKPNYEVLFSNLSPKDAGKIVESLKEKKIPYQIGNGGSTILVPSDKVYDLRLTFAQEGMPASSNVGYEIFDQSNLGMTDFIQQINYRRALEGELSRTIEQIEAVEQARVHIVIPREALFREDQKSASASVILRLRGNRKPSQATVQGVSHLIASSVEGLEPENITILDTRGRILSENQDPNDLMTMSSSQLEYSKNVEGNLAKKVQSMLDEIVGVGNAVVRVTAELNFKRVEKQTEEYDPDNSAVRSEEIVEESTPVGTGDQNSTSTKTPTSKSNSTVTNYELNKTVQRIVENVGDINRLSVAVIVNNKQKVTTNKDGEKQVTFTPRTKEEMNMIRDLVQTAVGFRPERGDQVSVTNVDFSLPPNGDELLDIDKPGIWDNWYNIIEKIFLLLAVISAMLIVRSLFTQVRKRSDEIQQKINSFKVEQTYRQLPPPQTENSDEEEQEKPEDEIVVAENFFRSIVSDDPVSKNLQAYIKEKPVETASIIKVWLSEDDEEGT
ncbi:MAG TPA: flagellar M-ring protein FliF [Caldithrix sp.]|nr:flagellar M-ring protein FliF [Caldithrix sp.]